MVNDGTFAILVAAYNYALLTASLKALRAMVVRVRLDNTGHTEVVICLIDAAKDMDRKTE